VNDEGESGTVLATKDLLAKLTAQEDRPWATWRKDDKPMTGRALARLLGPLGIHPRSAGSLRGYRTDAFADAIARYLPSQVSKRQNVNNDGPQSPISMCQAPIAIDTLKSPVAPMNTGLFDALTHRSPVPGDGGDPRALDGREKVEL
jgi:hypothetical protein